VGVELLEASVLDLNKYKLRKTHQLGSFKYDPGKYYADDEKQHPVPPQETTTTTTPSNNHSGEGGSIEEVPLDKASFEDELEAPWNQYAWAEELRLRVSRLKMLFTVPFVERIIVVGSLCGSLYYCSFPDQRPSWF
jgi:hypothetical protein